MQNQKKTYLILGQVLRLTPGSLRRQPLFIKYLHKKGQFIPPFRVGDR